LHPHEELGEKQVLPGLYMSVQKDVLDQIIGSTDGQFRVYSGHAGWGGGQLEGELSAGGWVLGQAAASDVFDAASLAGDGTPLWRAVLNRIGLSIMLPDAAHRWSGNSSRN
jgi:putative transcriptional regulator